MYTHRFWIIINNTRNTCLRISELPDAFHHLLPPHHTASYRPLEKQTNQWTPSMRFNIYICGHSLKMNIYIQVSKPIWCIHYRTAAAYAFNSHRNNTTSNELINNVKHLPTTINVSAGNFMNSLIVLGCAPPLLDIRNKYSIWDAQWPSPADNNNSILCE